MSLGRLWAIDNAKQLNSKAIRCSTPSATCSTCSTWTRCSWQIIPRMGRKKSWQVETPSRVGKSRCYSCFLMVLSCIGEWLHDARCFHPVLASNREIAHVCAGYASSFPAWKRTYHDLPTAVFFWWCEVKRPEPICRSCGILILSATAKKWFRCLFELLVHLNPLRQGALRTGEAPDFIDGFLGHHMINESDSVKCRPGPISKLILHSQSQPSKITWR